MLISSMSSEKSKKHEGFDNDSIESLKTYYKIKESEERDLYRFIKQHRTIPDES